MSQRLIGLFVVVASAVTFGSGPLFAKGAYAEGMQFLALMAWRFLLGALAVWAWIAISPARRRRARRTSRRHLAFGLALGVLYVANSGTFYAGLEVVSASIAALIVFTYPAIVAVLSLRFGRRLEGRRAWGALVMALTGCALTVGGIGADDLPPIGGLLLIAVCPFIYAGWILLQAWLGGERADRDGGTAAGDADPAVTAALVNTGAAAVYWIWAIATAQPVLPDRIPSAAIPFILGIGILSTFVAILGFVEGSRRIGAARAAIVSTIEPMWTIVVATLLLGEALTLLQALGGVLIIAGVALAQSAPTTARGGTGLELAAVPLVRIDD